MLLLKGECMMTVEEKADAIYKELSGLKGYCRIIIDLLKTVSDDGALVYLLAPHIKNAPKTKLFEKETQELTESLEKLIKGQIKHSIVIEMFMVNYSQISNLLKEMTRAKRK